MYKYFIVLRIMNTLFRTFSGEPKKKKKMKETEMCITYKYPLREKHKAAIRFMKNSSEKTNY